MQNGGTEYFFKTACDWMSLYTHTNNSLDDAALTQFHLEGDKNKPMTNTLV